MYAILENGKVKPVNDVLQWAQWFEDIDNRKIAQTRLREEVHISTVFIGIDHGFGGRPLWFETMVFGGPLDNEQDRYETKEEAEAGHAAMVEKVRAELAKQEGR